MWRRDAKPKLKTKVHQVMPSSVSTFSDSTVVDTSSVDRMMEEAEADVQRIVNEASQQGARRASLGERKGKDFPSEERNARLMSVSSSASEPPPRMNMVNDMRSENVADLEADMAIESSDDMNAGIRLTRRNNGVNTRDVADYGESDEEEVLLSHQRMKGEHEITAELKDKFSLVVKQLGQFRDQLESAQKALKARTTELRECEVRLEQLQIENQTLKRSGAMGIGSSSGSGRMGVLPSSTGGAHSLDISTRVGALNKIRAGSKTKEELQLRAEQVRRALLAEDGNEDEDIAGVGLIDGLLKSGNSWERILHLLQPFKRDVAVMQARFGYGVASYFVFQRFLFVQFTGLAVVLGIFGLVHLSAMAERTQLFSDYLLGSGFVPYFMVHSSYAATEKRVYSAMLVLTLLFTLVLLCIVVVQEDKRSKSSKALEATIEFPYCKMVLCGWDFSQDTKQSREDFAANLSNQLLVQLEQSSSQDSRASRSNYALLVLYLRRAIGLLLYLAVQALSGTFIVVLTIYSNDISASASSVNGLKAFSALITPFMLAGINGTMPTVLKIITEIEKWDSAVLEQTVTLLRIYVSSLLNSALLAYSYLLLADPFLFADSSTLREQVDLGVSENYKCRMDQAADGLFTLVLLSWALREASFLLVPLGTYKAYQWAGKEESFSKPQFLVPQNIVQSLTLLGQIFMSAPFAPLTLCFAPFYFYLTFKWQKYIIKRWYSKPRRPWKAHNAAMLYSMFYLTTFVMMGVSMAGYVLTSKTLAKDCAIQDDYVGLCASKGVLFTANNTCITSPSSKFYGTYGSEAYPAVVCSSACGPFVEDRCGMAPFADAVNSVPAISVLWSVLFQAPYVSWLTVIALALGAAITRNSVEVGKIAAYERERVMDSHILAVEADRKKQEGIIRKLKTIVEEPDSDANHNS